MKKQTYTLNAKKRDVFGKKVSALRDESLMPAVAYGQGGRQENLTVDQHTFTKIYREAGESSLVDLVIDSEAPVKVLVHDVQTDPVLGRPLHVDFYLVTMTEKLTTSIPLVFVGESKAVKEQGGILIKNIDDIEVRCLPTDLVPEIEVSLEPLIELESAVHIRDLVLPTGIELSAHHHDPADIVVIVTPPVTEEKLKKMEEEGGAKAPAEAEKSEEKGKQEEEKKSESRT